MKQYSIVILYKSYQKIVANFYLLLMIHKLQYPAIVRVSHQFFVVNPQTVCHFIEAMHEKYWLTKFFVQNKKLVFLCNCTSALQTKVYYHEQKIDVHKRKFTTLYYCFYRGDL